MKPLTHFIPDFQAAVLAHVLELPPVVYEAQRHLATDESRWPVGTDPATDTDKTPEQLVAEAVTEDGISLSTLLGARNAKPKPFDQIDGQPVYYLSGLGVYAWAPDPDARQCLVLWLSHPAHPLGW